jgi:hypothetical protein
MKPKIAAKNTPTANVRAVNEIIENGSHVVSTASFYRMMVNINSPL